MDEGQALPPSDAGVWVPGGEGDGGSQDAQRVLAARDHHHLHHLVPCHGRNAEEVEEANEQCDLHRQVETGLDER